MKIFNFSLDQNLLNQESAVSQRLVSLGQITERYLIMVPTRFDRSLDLSDKVSVLGVGGKIKIQILIRIFIQAYKILKQDHYDLITVQDTYFLALVAWILERRFKLPLEIQVHGFERFRLIRKILARFLLARATGVRVVSQRLKEQLITEFKIPAEKISTISVVNDFKCDEMAPLIPREESEFIFLTVARLVKVKNIEAELRVLAKLKLDYPQVRLWLVGDGPERQNLDQTVADLGLQNMVKFWGQRSDLASFYRSADTLVLFSKSEGWGLVVLEAGLCGLPVIMSDVGCADEVVKDRRSGLVVPVGDGLALEQALRQILTDESLRTRLAQNLSYELSRLPDRKQSLELQRQTWSKLILSK
ncbi:MAG: hypothetical protein COX02_01730 [Candidatus Vogelbacteria bacterium CG22_combo_CG10-13_8_21_14_all_37_9]|uniref:Glycosyl transferase family 1 domain-containing protein n=1 Tax=Candidatus Vogelbacteria bacterium CG22_combo_CG10-13_8_21_14_all_37_9 TaxID=1975046 RepID=A0A2H0BKL7_9BACT|nr:MAG: hypothetical protein BK005_02130 [bacterium CG10_37_50]PIP58144.1 MAG: hypothetical protein COX02_01730 [Candidatus Vogelbacteria bacterium CG22_combo_CG10-13_8_21_14_all_37_9]